MFGNIFVTASKPAFGAASRYKYKQNQPMSNMSFWQMV